MDRAPRTLLRRLGVLGRDPDHALARGILAVALALYTVGFAAFYPHAITNNDEGRYIKQTRLWLETGSVEVSKEDPLTGATRVIMPGDYPIGMVAIFAPFVAAFGWRGAFLPSFLAVVVSVLVTARWLRQERRPPVFALLLLGFPALLVIGRMAMSDTARTAVAAIGLWAFFRGLDGRKGWWLASGVLAGASLTLRENSVLPFMAFFAGSALRRDRGWGWLLAGGLAGVALHLTANAFVFGDPFFVRATQAFYPFELDHLHERLPLYLLGLLVFVPGGLVLGLAYRGRRRPEVLTTIVGFFFFFLFQAYGAAESGFVKSLVIGLRYFAPLLPVLAFAMAESVPRLFDAAVSRSRSPSRLERLGASAVSAWIVGVGIGCFLVHPVLHGWSASQAEIREAIERHVPKQAVLITNGVALRKFVDEVERPYLVLQRMELAPADVNVLHTRHGAFFIAFLDRSDSEFWQRDAADNEDFVTRLPWQPLMLMDRKVSPTDRLRIWRVPADDGSHP